MVQAQVAVFMLLVYSCLPLAYGLVARTLPTGIKHAAIPSLWSSTLMSMPSQLRTRRRSDNGLPLRWRPNSFHGMIWRTRCSGP